MKIGDKVKVVKNSYSHTYEIGKIYTITSVYVANRSVTLSGDDGNQGSSQAGFNDVELIYDVETLTRNISELKNDIDTNKRKLNFLLEMNEDELDEEKFKVSLIIDISKDDKTNLSEKTKLIGKLISN